MTLQSPAHIFFSWIRGRGRRVASPTTWSIVDQPGHGAHANRVSPPSADLCGGRRRRWFHGFSSRGTTSASTFSPERTHRAVRPKPALQRTVKSRDMEAAMSGIRRIGGNYDPNPALWRTGCNTHPTLRPVTTTRQTQSPAGDRVPIVPLSIALTDTLIRSRMVERT
jgi:hypothetical protein